MTCVIDAFTIHVRIDLLLIDLLLANITKKISFLLFFCEYISCEHQPNHGLMDFNPFAYVSIRVNFRIASFIYTINFPCFYVKIAYVTNF